MGSAQGDSGDFQSWRLEFSQLIGGNPMRLLNRLTLFAALIGLLLLAIGVSGGWYVLRLQRANSRLLEVNVSSIRAAEEIEILVRKMQHELDRFVLTQDHEHLRAALRKRTALEDWLDRAHPLSGSEQEGAFMLEIRHGLDASFARLQQIIDSPGETGATAPVIHLTDELLTGRVLLYARQFLDLNEEELQTSNDQNKVMAERFALALILLGTCGAIAGIVAGYSVANGIRRSIFQLSLPIRDMAGKLDEVVGPIEISAEPSVVDLETILRAVSDQIESVVEQFHARHREAIRASQLAAVGQLAAGLAHELRNPLMCMKTLVQSTRRRGNAAHLDGRDLEVLDGEIARLQNLLQAFLEFSRPAKPETRDFDVTDLVRQTVAFLSSKAEHRDVTIRCQLPNDSLIIHADPSQFRQVLLNLSLNALDAVKKGGTVWVDARRDEDGRKTTEAEADGPPLIRVQVADDGCGLPTNDRGRIYEPFFSTKETGLGLGLAISKRIVEAHGGELVSHDREGGGAIFEILMPAPTSVTSQRS
jgi:signal transduction histidine kinase